MFASPQSSNHYVEMEEEHSLSSEMATCFECKGIHRSNVAAPSPSAPNVHKGQHWSVTDK